MMLTAMDRFYVGEVLDIYKQAASSRYGLSTMPPPPQAYLVSF
jgi:hypothetical protein